MTPEQFCYWLQGFVELGGDSGEDYDTGRCSDLECCKPYITEEQWAMIKEHLQLVFKKETLNLGSSFGAIKMPGIIQPGIGPNTVTVPGHISTPPYTVMCSAAAGGGQPVSTSFGGGGGC